MNNIDFIKKKLYELLNIVNELEERFPGRKFTLDGHLFGSLGEVIASDFYNIELAPTGTKTYDGTINGKEVQIKITQGSSVDINNIPHHLLVLRWDKQNGEVYEVYNGPCDWLRERKITKNGWYTVTLNKLYDENNKISDSKRLKANTDIKRWYPLTKNK